GLVALSPRFTLALLVSTLSGACLVARADASLSYYAIVVGHVAVGAVAAAIAAFRLRARPGVPTAIGLVLIVASGALGVFLTVAGATRLHRPELIAHAVLGTGGVAALLWVASGVAARRGAPGGRATPIVAVGSALAIAVPLWGAVVGERSRAAR